MVFNWGVFFDLFVQTNSFHENYYPSADQKKGRIRVYAFCGTIFKWIKYQYESKLLIYLMVNIFTPRTNDDSGILRKICLQAADSATTSTPKMFHYYLMNIIIFISKQRGAHRKRGGSFQQNFSPCTFGGDQPGRGEQEISAALLHRG